MPYFPFNMFPYSNIHNLNLDWMLAVMQELTRKITEYEGSATPYDGTPLMDGAGSPGDSPNYARGNHRHPTDSSKFDKTGGTITGILDVAPRRVWAYLATPGWYRVLSFESNIANDVMGAAGMQIDLFINRSGVDNEAHKITLDLIYNPAFIDEVSRSNNNLITKVRYTKTTTGAKQYGYVDIYYVGSAQNTVLVDFKVHTASPSVMEKVNAAALQYVAASPAGETVLSRYGFVATTEEQIMFTPTTGDSYASFGSCWYSRIGKTVHLHVGLSGLTANTSQVIYTLPVGFRPVSHVAVTGGGGTSYTAVSSLSVLTDGKVEVASVDQYAIADITYPAKVEEI